MSVFRKALAITLPTHYATMVIQFVATVVIARLLSPVEIGIYSVGAAILGLGHLLRDFGSGQYIVQEQELTEQRIRAAFSVTLLLGWSIALLLLFISPYAADFYQQPGVEEVLALLALNFFLLPFGSITLAFCRRNMNFKPAAFSGIASSLVQASSAMLLAYLGFSYMSLAWSSLAGTVTTIVIVIIMRPPNLPYLPGFKEIGRVISYGGQLSTITILNHVGAVIPELVLGKTQGFQAVGLFSRTQGTIALFQQLLLRGAAPVIGAAFANQKRAGGDVRASYLYGTLCVTGLAWVFYANLAALASPFILTLFGEKWAEIIPLVQLWCIAASLYHLTSLTEQVFTNTGELKRVLHFSLIMQPIRIAALAGAAFIDLQAVMLVILTLPFLRLALLWPQLRAVLGISISDYVPIIRKSASPAVSSAGMAIAVQHLLATYDVSEPVYNLLLGSMASAITWLFVAKIFNHSLIDEMVSIYRKKNKSS